MSKLNHNHSSTLRYVANTFGFPGILLVTACATITPLPEPADKANSLLIVGLRVEFESVLMTQVTYTGGKLVLRRADEPGTAARLSQTQIVSNYPNGQYFLFANMPSGTYHIDHFAKTMQAEVEPNHPDYNLVFTFTPQVINGTTVHVSPRSVVYVGDFTVRYKQRIASPRHMVRYEVAETSGNRSEKGKAQAIETFQKHYGSSPWAAYAIAP